MSTPTTTVDARYRAWMQAEFDEQAALIMLGACDTAEVRARAELASERVQAAREAYEAAMEAASPRSRSAVA